MVELDEKDYSILDILKEKGRISYTDLGEELDISDVAAKQRISKLQEEGIISNFTVNISYEELGKPLHSFLLIKSSPEAMKKIKKKVRGNSNIVNTYRSIGEYDLLIEVACEGLDKLKELTEREIGNLPGVQEIRTSIITE